MVLTTSKQGTFSIFRLKINLKSQTPMKSDIFSWTCKQAVVFLLQYETHRNLIGTGHHDAQHIDIQHNDI
jgi:hypothetical protein